MFSFKRSFKSNNTYSPYNIPEVARGNMNEKMPDSRNCTFNYVLSSKKAFLAFIDSMPPLIMDSK